MFALQSESAKAQSQTQGGNPLDTLPAPAQPAAPRAASPDTRILPAAPPPQAATERQIRSARFEIEGVQAISFDEVAALFAPLSGKTVTVGEVAGVAEKVTALYQQQGYALSFAYLPQQDFDQGTVRVVAVEGHIDNVQIDGDAGPAEPRLRELAEKIRQEKPLRRTTFERYTQLMGQLPGVGVVATAVPPATTDGAGALKLAVTRQPYSVSLGTELRHRKPRGTLTGTVNDPLVAGSSLSLSTLLGAEHRESYGAVSYSQVVGSDGLTLIGDASAYQGDPDANLDTPPAVRRYTTYRRVGLSARYPLQLTARESTYLNGGIYGVNNADDYTDPASNVTLTDDVRVRAVYAQLSHSANTADRARYLAVRLTQGLDALGASARFRANVAGALPDHPSKVDFTRVSVDASQRNDWGNRWGSSVAFGLQYSPHLLPATERVSFGGARFARAYAAGAVASDSGWGIALEANRSFAVNMAYVTQIQPYVLLERAQVYSEAGALAFSRLGSTSLGVRVSGGGYYTVDLALSKPTGEAASENPERKPRLSALISYNFNKR